ncbi:MAG TPA: hypothetical protein PLR76_09910 [Hyphomonas sp.]|nr:hypothetical protein [Hyphomonas sp.]
MPELAICSLLWDANRHSQPFSSFYDETWVERLYHGVARNLTRPFEFIVFSDRPRQYSVPVTQIPLSSAEPDYGNCIEPYKLGQPMILMGLDTIITGNIDALAEYCLTADRFALPLDPYNPAQVCNGVALVPAGHANIGFGWNGENDMEWVRRFNPAIIDTLFPGQVVSYKGHVRQHGLGDARVVYFHGEEKPHQLREAWVREHWKHEETDMERRNNTPEILAQHGEVIKGASGWKAREEKGLKRNRALASEDRMKIRAGRAENLAREQALAEAQAAGSAPKSEPMRSKPVEQAKSEPEVQDEVSALSDADLAAYYEQVVGKPPHHSMKRQTIEAKVREALA